MKRIILRDRNPILNIDFNELSEVNPALCEKFLNNYSETKDEFLSLISEVYDKKNCKLRPINLPQSSYTSLSNLSSTNNLNKLINTTAILEYRSDSQEGKIIKSKFECPGCGTIIEVIQLTEKFQEPKRCSCGRKGFFKLISNEVDDYTEIIVRSTDPTKNKIRMNVHLIGKDHVDYLNKNLSNGKLIELIGIYKSKPKMLSVGVKSNTFTSYIKAESIRAVDEDLLQTDFTEEEEKEFEVMAKEIEDNGLDNIISKVFPSSVYTCVGQECLVEGWILQLVSGKNYSNGEERIRNKPHIFVAGEPALNKTRQIEFAKRIDPKIKAVNGSTSSTAGLLMGMDTFEGKKFISGGALTEANNSILIIDEIQKFDNEARGSLHDALASQKITYNKVGFQIQEEIDVAMSFFGNPSKDYFDPEPIYHQIKNPKGKYKEEDYNGAFLSRCDLVIGMRDNISKDIDIAEIKFKTLNKDQKADVDTIKRFIYFAKNKDDPLFTDVSQKKITEYFTDLRKLNSGYNLTVRLLESFQIFSKCYARLRLSETVEVIDVDRTFKLLMKSFQSIELPNMEEVNVKN